MFDLQKMLKQAQKMQGEMGAIKEEIERLEVTGVAGGGAVTVTCSGKFEFKAIKINPDVAKDLGLLEDILLLALNDATRQGNEETNKRMSKLTDFRPPGFKLPGM